MRKKISILFSVTLVLFGLFTSHSIAKAAWCWCFDINNGTCPFADQSVTVGLTKYYFACTQQEADQPSAHSHMVCDNYCTSRGLSAIHCDPSALVSLGWDKKGQWEGGCIPSVCWCANQSHQCTSYPKNTKTNKYFANQAECNSFCQNLGDEATSYKAVFFDNSDHNAAAECNQPKPIPGTKVTPKDSGKSGDVNGTLLSLNTSAGQHFNPGNLSTPTDLIGVGIRAMLMFLGSIALILYIYAGVSWMTAFGNSERTSHATEIIKWTTLGVAVALGSYVILNTAFTYISTL